MNIYVANIAFRASDSELKELFQQHGDVSSAKIVVDKLTSRSRGFGFVEMSDGASGKKAIQELNGYSFQGKELAVSEARPKSDDSRGGGGSYGNRSGGGFGGNSGGFKKRW